MTCLEIHKPVSRQWALAAWAALLVAAAWSAPGCDGLGPEQVAVGQSSPAPGQAEAPAGQAAAREVMATVNGQPVYMDEFVEALIQADGLQTAQQFIALELVRQEAERAGVSVEEAEIQAEADRTLARLFEGVEKADQRERLLQQMLTRRHITSELWRRIMHRNALLRKLVEPDVQVGEEDLREEFGARFGRQVEVRHIQTASLTQAQQLLRELAGGADFAELAAKYSLSPSARDGGLLPRIGTHSELVPEAIRNVALAMRQPGEISEPIQVGTAFHILKLERVIEPQAVRFLDVRDSLAQEVRERKIAAAQQALLARLIQAARRNHAIRYVNPTLRQLAAEREDRP